MGLVKGYFGKTQFSLLRTARAKGLVNPSFYCFESASSAGAVGRREREMDDACHHR